MGRTNWIVVLMLAIVIAMDSVSGREIYVAPGGDDDGPGTREKPLRTLQTSSAQAKAGDTVILRGGIYRETLKVRHSGTAKQPIRFRAAEGEEVVLTGTEPVTDWKPHKGEIVQARIPKALEPGFNQVFLDGRMLSIARFPNQVGDDLFKPTMTEMSAGKTEIASSSLSQPDGFWNGGFVVGVFGHRWSYQCATVKEYRQGRLILSDLSGPWFDGKGEAYVAGVLGALDAPGEWHVQDGNLYVWPPAGTDLKTAKFEIKQRLICVDFAGKSHVIITGLAIRAGGVRMAGDENVLENCRIAYPSHFTRFPWSGYASDGGAEDGHQGILVRGDNNTVHGCTITSSAGSGLVIMGRRNRVTRCEISDTDYSGTYSCPVTLRAAKDKAYGENRIHFNTIHRTGRDCIQMYGALADDIQYNDIYDTGLLCKDLGMIYVWGCDGKGTRIAHNWVHDNRGKGPNPGIYLDNFCRNFAVDHNVIWNCEAGVRVNGPAEGHKIFNNTLFRCQDVGTQTYTVWPPRDEPVKAAWPAKVYQYDSANNLFLGKAPENELTDVEARQFWPKPGSKAIDAGKAIANVTDGSVGKAPDLGAYEVGGRRWTAGVDGTAGGEE